MDLSADEIISGALNGNRYDIVRSAYGIELTFTISYVSQQSMWRIDSRADESVLIYRKHFKTTVELLEALAVIGIT